MWQKWNIFCETEVFDSVEIIVATCKMAAGDRVLQVRFASNLSEQVCESLFLKICTWMQSNSVFILAEYEK